MRGTFLGEMSFIGHLGRKDLVGALLSQGELMVLVSGRRLGRNEIQYLFLLSSLWGMEADFTFGRMLVTSLYYFFGCGGGWKIKSLIYAY